MNLKKMSNLLQLAIKFPNIVSEDAYTLLVGQQLSDEEWDLLVRYYDASNTINQEIPFEFKLIGDEYALIRINKNLIGKLSDRPEVIYMELPIVMAYIADSGLFDVCITDKTVSPQGFNLSGKGVLVGIIDSGIDYFHPDFRKEDGTTRIVGLWDQSGKNSSMTGDEGIVYTSEQINQALSAPTREEGLKIVPEVDQIGHGTAVAGIAAGNGRASRGKYRGVAPEADLLIVKVNNTNLGAVEGTLLPRNVDIMMGIDYVLEEARRRKQPISLMLGYGVNEGSHDGKSSLERFIDKSSFRGKNNIVVGAGNQANKDSHTKGVILKNEVKDIPIFIEPNQPYYYLTLVNNYSDTLTVQLVAPTGERTEFFTSRTPNRGYIFGTTGVMINFSGPDPNTSVQQITVLLEKFEDKEVLPGLWTLRLKGEEIIIGEYNIWATSIDPYARTTRFLEPNPLMTVTIPGTAERITTVGGLNQQTQQILPFSGRGLTLDNRIKPDVVAPANKIIAPSSLKEDGYNEVTGTSAAAAFMTGGYALLLEYGMREQPDNYIYGEELKVNVIKHTKRPTQYEPYPNIMWGYGIMCIDKVLDALKEQYDT